MNHPNEIQVGGDHYRKAGNLQHWDMLPDCGGFGWEYYVGMATKYLTRVKDKALDPGKAGHTIDKLISLIDEGRVPAEFQSTQGTRINCDAGGRKVDVPYYLEGYFTANRLDPAGDEAKAISVLMQARIKDDLIMGREFIRRLEPALAPAVDAAGATDDNAQNTGPTSAYVSQDSVDKDE